MRAYYKRTFITDHRGQESRTGVIIIDQIKSGEDLKKANSITDKHFENWDSIIMKQAPQNNMDAVWYRPEYVIMVRRGDDVYGEVSESHEILKDVRNIDEV